MMTLFHLRIPFVLIFLALTVWMFYTVFRKDGRGKWL
jgi:hypothetical protein